MALDKATREQFKENIRSMELALKDVKEDIDEGQRAGFDMSAHRQTFNELQQKIRKAKRVYG